MYFQQKIKLENNIFARAEKLHVQVYARAGKFISSSEDKYLMALLSVYNAFFSKENWENFCTQEDALEGLRGFKKQITHAPLLSIKDYKFEFIMGGENA